MLGKAFQQLRALSATLTGTVGKISQAALAVVRERRLGRSGRAKKMRGVSGRRKKLSEVVVGGGSGRRRLDRNGIAPVGFDAGIAAALKRLEFSLWQLAYAELEACTRLISKKIERAVSKLADSADKSGAVPQAALRAVRAALLGKSQAWEAIKGALAA
ncbi:hypothetical protein [Saccharopolyspora sp. ASAGF58]|uniref:hypothetical protein n=1 Tax=Saccharopolyspora sp. ASAGF58 TaxID=2719023 RepID=UPI001B31475E|nr:hypothetical protein [Saccharopolyspora sp. ASAGF58]